MTTTYVLESHQARATGRGAVAIYMLTALCEGFDVQAAGVAATGILGELKCTPAELGLFFSASGIGLMIGSVVGGGIADRRGRKLVLVASIGAFGAFSLLTAVMPSLPLLAVARFLTGLGLGGAIPSLLAMAFEIARPTVAIVTSESPISGCRSEARLQAFWRSSFHRQPGASCSGWAG
jgi:MFS transporter, AAHS family, 3-hydroxyphenylpropionic acid transporter